MKNAILLAALALLSCAPAGEESAAPRAAAPTVAGGTLLIGNKGEDSMSFVSLADGRELGRAPTGRMPHEIAVSPDGRQAAVVAYGGRTIDLFDVASRTKLRTIDLSPNEGPHGIVWLADGRLIVTAERSRSVAIVDTRARCVTRSRPADGTHMVRSPRRPRASTANIASGTVACSTRSGRSSGHCRAAAGGNALTPDGRGLGRRLGARG